MAFQYMGPFSKVLSPYGEGFLLLNLIDTRHGEIKSDIGTSSPLKEYYYNKGFNNEPATLSPILLQRMEKFFKRLVVDSNDVVWLIVDDKLVQRPYVWPNAHIKVGYDGTVFGSQATLKPDSSKDFGPNQIHGVPATVDTLKARGLL